MQLLKQSTASTVYVGPVLDSTGAAVTTAVVGDFRLIKNGTAATLSGAIVTHDANGYYTIALTTSNTDTTGRLTIAVGNTAQSMATHRYSVLLPSVYDALITNATNATGGLPTATGAISALSGAISTYAGGDTSGVTTLLTRLPSAISLNSGAVTVGTNNDKTGYSLASGGLASVTSWSVAITGNITGNLSGSVGSVTSGVTVLTNNDKTGYSLTQAFPSNFASLNIDVSGRTLLQPTQTGVTIPTVTSVTNGVTASTVSDKTGYSLTAGTGLGNQTANITGSIQSVTNRVTANTDQWNGVAVTGMPMPTFTLPSNFSALVISAGGYVTVNGDAFGNTLIIPNLASQSSVNTLTSYVDTEVAAIKAKTDLITNFPANFSSLSISSLGSISEVLELGPNAISANSLGDDIAAAVYNAMPSAGWTNGSFGDRLLIGDTAQRNVAVTGAHHVAADIHEFQAGVITAADFAAGAIDANALAADAATEIANAVAATQPISRLDSMIESNGAGQFRFDTIALSMGAGGGGGTVNIVVEDRSITVE